MGGERLHPSASTERHVVALASLTRRSALFLTLPVTTLVSTTAPAALAVCPPNPRSQTPFLSHQPGEARR
jgi:hypothetical protein